MIADVQQFCRSGRPVYAECGGMMFLSRSIAVDGLSYPMAEVLPLSIEMSSRLVKFGYVQVRFTRDSLLGPAGMETTGHSFHYSKIHTAGNVETSYSLQYLGARMAEAEGYSVGNVLASYIHLHFRSNPQLARHFVDAAFSRKLSMV
jgi:cobyrinic acid a,c-diamide synthase